MGEILLRIWDFTCGFKILLVEFQETEFLEFLEFRCRDLKFWQRNLESFESLIARTRLNLNLTQLALEFVRSREEFHKL